MPDATWLRSLKEWWEARRIAKQRKRARRGIRKDATRYTLGGGWGNAINLVESPGNRIVGWKSPRPLEGDVLIHDNRVYAILNIEYCRDPEDMFFADAVFTGLASSDPAEGGEK